MAHLINVIGLSPKEVDHGIVLCFLLSYSFSNLMIFSFPFAEMARDNAYWMRKLVEKRVKWAGP